ncbi:MAG: DUF4139 domain-containing protein [Rhodospirillales bacterium]
MTQRFAPMLVVLLTGLIPVQAVGAQEAPTAALRLTIYGNGLTLVDEARTLPAGLDKTVRLDRVGPMMIADSVRVALTDGPEVREIALDSDILTAQTLLERALGKTVTLVRTNPATGQETAEDATVLSVAGGLVLQVGERIETNPPGRIVFERVPDDLHATPTLSLTLAEPLEQPTAARLAYLTNGLAWNAVYTAVFNAAHDSLDLSGWAKIENNAGVDFGPALVSLVAGDVARETQAPQGKILMRAEAMSSADAFNVSASTLSAFHMYALPETVTLRDKETRQLRLMGMDGVVSRRVLEFRSGAPVFGALRGTAEPEPARQKIVIINDVASHLGLPLPAGLLRAYVRDDKGVLRFIGEDRIGNTATGQELTLDLGTAFDVTVQRKQIDFKQIGERLSETAFTLTLRNGGSAPAEVRVIEDIAGDWEILSETHMHKRDGITAAWAITVPAAGTVDLSYRVRVRR